MKVKKISLLTVIRLLLCPYSDPKDKKECKNKLLAKICRAIDKCNLIKLIIFMSLSGLISYLSLLNKCLCKHALCLTQTHLLGINLIGILMAASFFVMTLLYTLPIFKVVSTNCYINKIRRSIISQATLYTIIQMILVFICYLIVIFNNPGYLTIFFQITTLSFIILTDLHIFLHLFSLFISIDSNDKKEVIFETPDEQNKK